MESHIKPYSLLGYTKDEDGRLVVVPEEAEIVRKIFSLYLAGYGVRKIKRYLEENGIKTVTGKSEWSTSTIDRMLSNEKYMGNLLLQKTCTPDFLTGKQRRIVASRVCFWWKMRMSRLYQKKYLKMHKDGNIKCKMLGLS